jgi:predicted RecA/RadA family phage recombinase
MNAIYKQKGETIDYTNGGAVKITAGAIVSLTNRVGVAGCDIAVGAVGTLHLDGVFEVDKDANAITLGAPVFYDESEDCFTATAAGNIPAGWAVSGALAGDDTVIISLGDPNELVAALVAAVAAAPAVAVDTADATAAGDAYEKATAQTAVALANANKAAINVLVTLANANKTAINAILTSLKASGQMASA